MAVRFMDGCDHYPATDIGLLYKYDGITPGQWKVRELDGRFGGTNCIGTTGQFGAICTKQLLEESTSKYHTIGFAYQVDNYITSADDPMMHATNKGTSLATWSLFVADTGVLKLTTGSSLTSPDGTLRITTSAGLMTSAVYHFLEVELFVDPTVGYIRIWVDDVMEGEITGDTTSMMVDATNPVEGFKMEQAGIWATRYDDIHVLDGSGAVNNVRIGDARVHLLLPVEDGDTIQFTPDSGSNLTSVNETQGDGNASFVETGTIGNKDIYSLAETAVGEIFAVQPLALNTKTTSQSVTGAVIASNGTADFVAFFGPAQVDYKYMHGVFNVNPDSGLTWEATSVNQLQWGYKLQDIG